MPVSVSLPGDYIASIEEYESGRNTFDDGDKVRSTVVGIREVDKKLRVANIRDPRNVPIARAGDAVIGTVSVVMSSMIVVAIRFVNGTPTASGVECVCSTRNMRRKIVALAGDVVALKIVSRLNGTIHASMDGPSLGVLFTKCRKCGMGVIPSRDGIKCAECGWFDERKMSSDFGNEKVLNLSG